MKKWFSIGDFSISLSLPVTNSLKVSKYKEFRREARTHPACGKERRKTWRESKHVRIAAVQQGYTQDTTTDPVYGSCMSSATSAEAPGKHTGVMISRMRLIGQMTRAKVRFLYGI